MRYNNAALVVCQ